MAMPHLSRARLGAPEFPSKVIEPITVVTPARRGKAESDGGLRDNKESDVVTH